MQFYFLFKKKKILRETVRVVYMRTSFKNIETICLKKSSYLEASYQCLVFLRHMNKRH